MKRSRLAALLPLLPGRAAACAVCFGRSDGAKGLYNGIGWGIVVLLTITMSLLGAIAWLLWKVEKNRLLALAARGTSRRRPA